MYNCIRILLNTEQIEVLLGCGLGGVGKSIFGDRICQVVAEILERAEPFPVTMGWMKNPKQEDMARCPFLISMTLRLELVRESSVSRPRGSKPQRTRERVKVDTDLLSRPMPSMW